MVKSILVLALLTVFGQGESRSYSDDFIYLGSRSTSSGGFGIQSTRTSYYHLGRAQVPWTEAYFTCQRAFEGGALVAIETDAENSVLKDLLVKDGLLNVNVWTAGIYDEGSQAFRWYSTGGFADFGISGQWLSGYPVRNGNYPMVFKNSLFGKTQWATLIDSSANSYICEQTV